MNPQPNESHDEDAVLGAGDRVRYPAIEAALKRPIARAPEIDRAHIGAAVLRASDNGRADVQEYHRNLYMAGPGAEVAEFEAHQNMLAKSLSDLERQKQVLTKKAARTDTYRLDIETSDTPWTTFDLVKFGMYGVTSVAMLFVGWQALSTILLSSGIEAFSDPSRAKTFSLIPIAVSLIWEAIGSSWTTDGARRRYTGAIYGAAIILGVAWVYLFVQTFGAGLSTSAGDIKNAIIHGGSTDDPEPESGTTLLIVGLLAETFIASGCWMWMERVYRTHQHFKPIDNPVFKAIERDQRSVAKQTSYVSDLLGLVASRKQTHTHGCAAYMRSAQDAADILLEKLRNRAFVARSRDLPATPPAAIPQSDRPLANTKSSNGRIDRD